MRRASPLERDDQLGCEKRQAADPARRVRVVHVLPVWGVGGAENTASLVAIHHRRDVFDVRVILVCGRTRRSGVVEVPPNLLARLEKNGVPFVALRSPCGMLPYPWNWLSVLGYGLRLRKLIARYRPDVVVFQGVGIPLIDLIACHLAGNPVRTVLVGRSQYEPKKLTVPRWLVRKTVARLGDVFVGVSRSVMDSFIHCGLVPPWKVRVIQNGWDLGAFYPPPRPQKTQGFVIVSVARLSPEKDHETLLRAFALVKRVGSGHTKLLLVGDGPQRSQLESLANQLGIAGSVAFLGTRLDVPEILRRADLFVLCTHREGLPGALVEAMATALPVVATDLEPTRELIKQGRTGLLVPPKDPCALARAITWVRHNRAQASRMGLRAREAALKFDIQTTVHNYERLFLELLGQWEHSQ